MTTVRSSPSRAQLLQQRNGSGGGLATCLLRLATPLLLINVALMLRNEVRIFTNKRHVSTTQAFSSQSHHDVIVSNTGRGPQSNDLVKAYDFIYNKNGRSWDYSPIVVDSHKLVFFTIPKVGCTVWKLLFRRIMGAPDWNVQDGDTLLPHNPQVNGLKYLYDYSLEEASLRMTSPEWTRAIMVREPKERFLSAFLDKAVSNDHEHIRKKCCKVTGDCVAPAQTLLGFLDLCKWCADDHWRPQSDRMDARYWPYVDVVMDLQTAQVDAKALLERIGAWEEFGASGWGEHGDLSIFESSKGNAEEESGRQHATHAHDHFQTYYTPAIERAVERFYSSDYENPRLNFTAGICRTCDKNGNA